MERWDLSPAPERQTWGQQTERCSKRCSAGGIWLLSFILQAPSQPAAPWGFAFRDADTSPAPGMVPRHRAWRGSSCPSVAPPCPIFTSLLPASPPVHAAVLAINEAVDRGVAAETMAALGNPSAMLLGLREVLAGAYQEVLHQAKLEKGSNARNRVRRARGGAGRGGAHSLMCWWVLPGGGVPWSGMVPMLGGWDTAWEPL